MTIVFIDNYTVGADVQIDAYGGPDYTFIDGTAPNMRAEADTDRVQMVYTAEEVCARIIDPAAPTGNQEITATCFRASADYISASVTVRCAGTATTTGSYYEAGILNTSTIELYRVVAGVFGAPIATFSRTTPINSALPWRFRATGTNPVEIELQINNTAVCTFSDSNAARLQSGQPGIDIYQSGAGADAVWIDDVSVDDLIATGLPGVAVWSTA